MHWTDDRPLTHPGAAAMVAKLVEGLSGEAFVSKRRTVVFVCGGALDPAKPNMRSEFLDWANLNLKSGVKLILSEDAYKAALVHGGRFINLSEFEEILAALSDCVLLFPESPGSFSEMGIFATAAAIKNKTLIANDAAHLAKDSFLLLGPIHTIDADSMFNPSVTFDSKYGSDPTFPVRVWERIEVRVRHIPRKRRLEAKHFVELQVQQRLALLSWVVSTAGLARFGDVLEIVRKVYPIRDGDIHMVKSTLRTLVVLGEIREPSQELYFPEPDRDFDLEVKGDMVRLSSKFRLFWMKEFPSLWGYGR